MVENKLDKTECCSIELNWTSISGCIDHILEGSKCDVCDTIYEKRNTGSVLYVRKPNDTYRCGDCGRPVFPAEVIHPVHDGLFPLSGSGRTETENVPYCVECEDKPSVDGSFIDK